MPDYLDVARHLSADERKLRDAVREYVDTRVVPVIARHWEEGSFDAEWPKEIGALGVLGCNLEGYGCAGMSEVAYGVAMQELERGDSGVRSFASVQSSLVMGAIHAFGSEAHKRAYLPKLASGAMIGCFGLTEPEVGSNPSAMRTVALDDGDAYVLRGVKRWVTNGGIAEVAVVWARLGGPEGDVRGFLVPTATRGVAVRPIDRKLSLRASVTSELVLDDARIAKEAILPGVRGMRGPLSCLTGARLGIAWGAIGAASACFDAALAYAKQRVQFAGKPIAAHQLVQAKLTGVLTDITTMQLLSLEASRLKEAGALRPQQVSLVKRHNAEAALAAARVCRDLLGANGITLDYPVMRHMCNLETVVTYEGTHDVHTLVIGQDLTGIAAFE
jgi:alkylation response protein AidB-like acyl-CoA dehydrogenase